MGYRKTIDREPLMVDVFEWITDELRFPRNVALPARLSRGRIYLTRRVNAIDLDRNRNVCSEYSRQFAAPCSSPCSKSK
jgi:hypothetical protein